MLIVQNRRVDRRKANFFDSLHSKKNIPAVPLYFIILVCFFGIMSYQCGSSQRDKGGFQTILVAKRSLSPVVTALGMVKPQVGAEVRLGARISGKVEHLRANVGDLVERGQVIAELEKDELEAAVDRNQAELNRAEAALTALEILGPIEIEKFEADRDRLKAIYDLDEKEYERQSDLFKDNLTSQQILDQAREEFLVAKMEWEASEKTLELMRRKFEEDLKLLRAEKESVEAELRIADVELSYATLRAPISGIISSVSTQQGETVAAGLSAPTFVTIIDLERLQVETYVDEVDIGKIEIGQKATFSVESYPLVDIEGEVVAIYPKAVLRENVVFYNVVIKSLDHPSVVLRPEMTANVSVMLESRKDVLMVPATSVMKSGGSNFVYVIEKGKPARREVQIGLRQEGFIEIVEGLREGDEVLENHGDWKENE